LSLEVEIHALEREKDEASQERLENARKTLADVEEELNPLVEEYNQNKNLSDAITDLRKKIDELKAKADDAERKYDLASASDIRYYSIPQRQKKLAELEEKAKEQGEQISQVTPEMIAEVVARWTGIPVTSLVQSEREKLLKMEKILSKSVIGQPTAVKAVANAIRLNRSGLGNSNRPIASFLLVGPSGTGKTLLAKTVAQCMFNSADAMIRIDASEFSEKHTVSRLVGSTAGYIGYEEGGQLTEYVRRHPYCLVLVDEIEKASKEFVMLFLQILDDGRLTDGKGRVIDFRNTIIMMTSNLGATYMTENPSEGDVDPAVKALVNDAITKHFPPEFINRIDDIIFYRSLTHKDIRRVVEVRLKEIQERMVRNGRKIKISVDDEAKQWLAQAGYSPIYGARPLARVIQQELLNPLSKLILQGRIHDGEVARVTADMVKNRLVVMPNHDLDVQMVEEDETDMTSDEDEDEEMIIEEVD
jgi:ATP-dependent Clp protease ATP-binding subunit ClpA